MKYTTHSHRFAGPIIQSDDLLRVRYMEFIEVIEGITDDDLVAEFQRLRRVETARAIKANRKPQRSMKSLSRAINNLLRQRICEINGWQAEVDIFCDQSRRGTGRTGHEWRLDFACDNAFCVEVAFNHGEAIPWNLLKPVLACELNHVEKAIQGRVGIYVCATEAMKKAGNFDNACGEYEKALRYLEPMMNQLTIPIMLIGLNPPETFYIHCKDKNVVYMFDGDIDRFVGHEVVLGTREGFKKSGVFAGMSPVDERVILLTDRNGVVSSVSDSEVVEVEILGEEDIRCV